MDRPVLITGTPRSGKTCVYEVLRRAEEFFASQEPVMLWQPPGGPADDARDERAATERVRARIRRQCQRLVAEAGKERYLDNLSHHAIRLGYVHAVLPEARVIHVIRHPLEAVPEMVYGWTRTLTLGRVLNRGLYRHYSPRAIAVQAVRFARNYLASRLRGSRRTWGPVVPGLAGFQAGHTVVEVAAFQWVQMVEIALADAARLPSLPVLEVRFEGLLADPAGEAARIAEFAGVCRPEQVIQAAERIIERDHVHHEPLRGEHSPEEWSAIRRIVAPTAARLGYDLLAEDSP